MFFKFHNSISKEILCLVFLLILSLQSSAQNSQIIEAYEKGDYPKCLIHCERKAKQDANNLEAILYQAMVWTQFAKIDPNDEKYKTIFASASDKALKFLTNLRKKDRGRVYINAQLNAYNFVRSQLLRQADLLAAQGEMEASMNLYLSIMNQLQDKQVYFFVGCSWIKYNSPELGARYLNNGLKEYYRFFRTTGNKPEAGFLDKLKEAAEKLVISGGYVQAFSTFQFMDLLYARADDKSIDECYVRCLAIAMSLVKVKDKQLFWLLREHEKALIKHPHEEKISRLRNDFIKNATNTFVKAYHIEDEYLAQLETAYRYILDSLDKPDSSLQQINQTLLSSIYSSYAQKTKRSLQLYDVFLAINNNYDKEKNAAQKCLAYGFEQNDVFARVTALLIYRTKEKDMQAIAAKMEDLEKQLTKRLKALSVSYEDFDEVIYFMSHFPEFTTLKNTAKDYLLKHSKTLIQANDFSKAGLFIRRGKEYFPKEKEFKTLQITCVEKDYQLNYLNAHFDKKELKWTGSVEDCNPGTISKTAQEKTLQRYDFIRRLSGFPDGTILDDSKNKECQAAALCMKAQGKLSHSPDETWACYSKDAAYGANNSLGIGHLVDDCIGGMIQDVGSNNKATGHRGNLLSPRSKAMVYGATDHTVALSATNHKVHAKSVLARFDTDFISWPPRGPVPSSLVFNRWSFKPYRSAFRFENAKVRMFLDGKPIEVKLEYETAYKIGWLPQGIDKWSAREQRVKVLIEMDAKRQYADQIKRETIEYEVLILPEKKE